MAAAPGLLSDRDERTLQFLIEAAHTYALIAPAASRAMSLRFRAVAAAAGIEIHPNVRQRFCDGCSQIFVPGSNCHVSVKRGRRRRRRRRSIAGSQRRGCAIGHAVDAKTRTVSSSKKPSKKPPAKHVQYLCCVCSHTKRLRLEPKAKARAMPCGGKRSTAKEEARNAAAAAKRARAARSTSNVHTPHDLVTTAHSQERWGGGTGTAENTKSRYVSELVEPALVIDGSKDLSVNRCKPAPHNESAEIARPTAQPRLLVPAPTSLPAEVFSRAFKSDEPGKSYAEPSTKKRRRGQQDRMQRELEALGQPPIIAPPESGASTRSSFFF